MSEGDSETTYSDGSQFRTEYMLGDRMLNGTEKIFKLPTPFDIITSEYFSDYRKPLSGNKVPDTVFSYTLEKVENVDVDEQESDDDEVDKRRAREDDEEQEKRGRSRTRRKKTPIPRMKTHSDDE